MFEKYHAVNIKRLIPSYPEFYLYQSTFKTCIKKEHILKYRSQRSVSCSKVYEDKSTYVFLYTIIITFAVKAYKTTYNMNSLKIIN